MIKNCQIYSFLLFFLINLPISFAYGMEEDNSDSTELKVEKKQIRLTSEMRSLQHICLRALRVQELEYKKASETEWKKWVNDLPYHISQLLKSIYSTEDSDFVRYIIESDQNSMNLEHEFEKLNSFSFASKVSIIKRLFDYFSNNCLTLSDDHFIITLLNLIVSDACDMEFILHLRFLLAKAQTNYFINLNKLRVPGYVFDDSMRNKCLKIHNTLNNWFEICETNYNKIDNSLEETERQKNAIIDEDIQKKAHQLIDYFENDIELFKEHFQKNIKEEQQSILIYIFTILIPYKKTFMTALEMLNYFSKWLEVLKTIKQDLCSVFVHYLAIYPSMEKIIHGPEVLLMPHIKLMDGRDIPAPILNAKLYFMYKLKKYVFESPRELCLNLFASNKLSMIAQIIIDLYYKLEDCRLIEYFITDLFCYISKDVIINKKDILEFIEFIKILKFKNVFQKTFFEKLKLELLRYINVSPLSNKHEVKQMFNEL